jgi:hypothetical protein
VFAGNACGRTNQTVVNPIRGTVPAPDCLNGPLEICPGQTYSYSVCPISWPTAVTYDWQIFPAIPGTASIVFNGTSATVNYTAGFTSAQICVNGISIFGLPGPSYCITIVSNAPNPGVITGNVLPCQGSTEAYSIQPVPNATSYIWSSTITGAQVSSNGAGASVSFPTGTFNGDICVSAITPCGTTPQSCLMVSSDDPGDPGPITGPVTGLCNAANVNYSLSTSNALAYTWTLPAGVVINGASNLNTINLNFSSGFTNGNIIVEAFYNCGSDTSVISVEGLPQALSVTPDFICPLSIEQYTASSLGATTYTWTITGDDNSTCIDMPVCSQYFVEWGSAGGSLSVVASNACGTTAAWSLSGSSCRTVNESSLISVYPNPSSGRFIVEFKSSFSGMHLVEIYDLTGKSFFTQLTDLPEGNTKFEVNPETIAAGIYILKVTDRKGFASFEKICIE